MPIRKPWVEWKDDIDDWTLPGAMGIYEIADADQKTIYIGKADGRSPFGLRGELYRVFQAGDALKGKNWSHPRMGEVLPILAERAKYYRYEVNHNYYSRWIEDLTRYREDFETLPQGNLDDTEKPPTLGRYHWKSEEAQRGS